MAIPDKLRDFVNEQRQPLPPVTDVNELLNLESVQMMRLVAFLESELAFSWCRKILRACAPSSDCSTVKG
jgi:hypothetical protein